MSLCGVYTFYQLYVKKSRNLCFWRIRVAVWELFRHLQLRCTLFGFFNMLLLIIADKISRVV